MRAFIYREYGDGDGVALEEVDKPSPAENEVLVRVRSASVNAMDAHFTRGVYIMRPMTGWRRPKPRTAGTDFAGDVEAVGSGVTQFKEGDRVFGVAKGTFAEYACAAEDKIALIPPAVTYEQAATLPVAGVTALQAVRDKAEVKPGQSVMINGASGGVGTFAVQLAKVFGGKVTAVCSSKNVERAKSLGADRVIDYTREDFTKAGEQSDVLIDLAATRSMSELNLVMKPGSKFLPIGAPPGGKWFGPIPKLLALGASRFISKQKVIFFIARIIPEDLTALAAMTADGILTPAIDARYSFAEVPAALRYVRGGHARAKAVVIID